MIITICSAIAKYQIYSETAPNHGLKYTLKSIRAIGNVQNTLAMIGFFIFSLNFPKSVNTLIRNSTARIVAMTPHVMRMPSEYDCSRLPRPNIPSITPQIGIGIFFIIVIVRLSGERHQWGHENIPAVFRLFLPPANLILQR